MDDQTIHSLREALQFSPDNLPLRRHLAEMLLKANRLEEAEAEYAELMRRAPDFQAKSGLAKTFFAKKEYGKCNVLLETLIDSGVRDLDILLLHARALLREHEVGRARDIYKLAVTMSPGLTDEELDNALRQYGQEASELEDDEDLDDDEEQESLFLQKPTINFSHVGGMEAVKKEIDLKIIKPLLHPELYKAYGKKTGGGILLYGPPGCGKTFIARATAGQVNAQFISVGLNDILDMWIGNSEKNLHGLFQLARANTPCVLFFDEIDALGASRSDMKKSAGRHLINQFLQELDGVEYSNEGILVLGATNTPWHLDPAFRRPGRFDRILFVPPPDAEARESILRLKLEGKPTENVDTQALARRLEHFSGADIEAVIDIAVEQKIEQSLAAGEPQPLRTGDLQEAAKRHKPSTQEWFATAKNFALFANDTGLYDDILKHLNIKR